MNDSRLSFLGPLLGRAQSQPEPAAKKFSIRSYLPFALVVGAPTLVVAIYYLGIASPRYVSEAKFLVRSASQEQPSSLGVALQGVGLSNNATDAFSVHEYIKSRDAVRDLEKKLPLAEILSAAGADPLSRYPRVGQSPSSESLYKSFQRFLTVGYNTSSGISTLRVEAFTPQDAKRVAESLLDGGEDLVNALNERSTARAVTDAETNLVEAEARLTNIQTRLQNYRNREGIIDPIVSATEGSALIGELLANISNLRAERAQLASQAPQSPQLSILDARLAAYERQIESERRKLAGGQDSLASKISGYEALALEREMADKALATASLGLDAARVEARQQKLYLVRVVNPGLPDKPSLPNRWAAILAVLISTMLIYSIGWLIWAGLREHRQV